MVGADRSSTERHGRWWQKKWMSSEVEKLSVDVEARSLDDPKARSRSRWVGMVFEGQQRPRGSRRRRLDNVTDHGERDALTMTGLVAARDAQNQHRLGLRMHPLLPREEKHIGGTAGLCTFTHMKPRARFYDSGICAHVEL